MQEDKAALIKHIRPEDFFRAGDATWLAEVVHPKNDPVDLPYSLALAKLAPGEASLPHSLAQAELYFVIQGTGVAYVGQAEITVNAFSTWLVPAQITQHVQNTGSEELIFICIVSPPWTAQGEVLSQ